VQDNQGQHQIRSEEDDHRYEQERRRIKTRSIKRQGHSDVRKAEAKKNRRGEEEPPSFASECKL